MFYEDGIDPLVDMKIAGQKNCQTTASIYIYVRDGIVKKSTVTTGDVLRGREE